MNRYIAATAAILAGLLSVSHAEAQLAVARVVATCGTVSPTPHAGATYPLTIDITGTLCSVGGGGGGGGGTSSNFGATFPGAGTAAGAEYLSSAPTFVSGNMVPLQTDINGNLKITGSISASNPSVSTTGTAVPASATYMGMLVGGNLTGVPGTANGIGVQQATAANLNATVVGTGTFATQLTGATNNINNIAGTISLPTGASTSALQTTGNTSLSTIATNTTGVATAANQTTGNTSLSTIATNTTNAATTTLQTTGNTSLSTIATNTTPAVNRTPTACSGTITAGGTAQSAITAQTTLHGFTIANIDASAGSGEPLWISFTTTAAASGTDSYPIAAPTVTTFAGMGSYTTPNGFGTNHAVSIIAATTGHKFSCTWW